jgi:hypothetical protein
MQAAALPAKIATETGSLVWLERTDLIESKGDYGGEA